MSVTPMAPPGLERLVLQTQHQSLQLFKQQVASDPTMVKDVNQLLDRITHRLNQLDNPIENVA